MELFDKLRAYLTSRSMQLEKLGSMLSAGECGRAIKHSGLSVPPNRYKIKYE